MKKAWKAFDDAAAEWDERKRFPLSAARLLAEGTRGARALDAGCGNGRNALLLAGFKEVHACDASPALVACAKKNLGERVVVQEGDCLALPYANGFFDAAFYFAVLHHFPDEELPRALAEAWRVLAADGKLYASVWTRDSGEKSISIPKRDGGKAERYYRFYSLEELRHALEKQGFKILDSFYEARGERVPARESQNLCFIALKVN
ncbi:MAG: class I SAM-dependent methyltransferase [Candidatus Micrarchaeia archaeon]